MLLSWLAQVFTQEEKDWRSNTVFLLDGASYHRAESTKAHFKRLGVDVVLSAAYSYDAAPCELFFAYFK